ncbi:unnamed protein product [Schistocephalus solidus]|uniref:Uncharacterized protein n=1 Tax=Schistocephalus solidus TaxID=70667 RepID=A0A183T1I4_SCHSO|nr:unnamed protein product [Schistocephalus solidus]
MNIHDSGIHPSVESTDMPRTPSTPATRATPTTLTITNTTRTDDKDPGPLGLSCPHCACNCTDQRLRL